MSTPGPSTKESRDDVSVEARGWRGIIRRLAITLTSGGIWQMVGHNLPGNTKEIRKVEVFSGIGFASRPAAGANAEAVVVHVGGYPNPIAVAMRDEDLRRKMAPMSFQDITVMFNTRATVQISGGVVSIFAPGGATHPMVCGDTLNSALDTLLSLLSPAVALISNIPGLTAPQLAVVTAATTAISTFRGSLSSWLTTILQAQ